MDWAFKIKERTKIAYGFSIILLLLLTLNVFITYNVGQINDSFRSMYEDRLVPAMDISDVQEKIYLNRLHLEDHIISKDKNSQLSLEKMIRSNQNEIDSLISKFEKTYIVDEENKWLKSYKKHIALHRKSLNEILILSSNGQKVKATDAFLHKNFETFKNSSHDVHQLITIQEKIGKELFRSAESRVFNITMLSKIFISLSFIISIIILVLLKASLIVNQSSRFNSHNNSHLN